MLDSAISARIREFIGRTIRADFSDTDDIFALGFVNSLFAMQLVQFIEQAFDVEVDSDDLELDNFRTAVAITRFVQRKRATAA